MRAKGVNGDGLVEKSRPIVSHMGNWELLLIRTGHHLWARYKHCRKMGWPSAEIYLAACETVWEAKRQYRRPFLAAKAIQHAEFVSRNHKRRQNARFIQG